MTDVLINEYFQKIGSILTEDAKKISDAIQTKQKYDSNILELSYMDRIPKEIDTLKCKNSGVYVFVATKEIKTKYFNDVEYAPKIKDKSLMSFNKGDILYLGKSEDSLTTRLKEHIEGPTAEKTYALRLSHENRVHSVDSLELYVFSLKKNYMQNKKIILLLLESYLHSMLNPKVGTKRSG